LAECFGYLFSVGLLGTALFPAVAQRPRRPGRPPQATCRVAPLRSAAPPTRLRSSVRRGPRRPACCLPGPHDRPGRARGYGAGTGRRVRRAWWPPAPAAALGSCAGPRWRRRGGGGWASRLRERRHGASVVGWGCKPCRSPAGPGQPLSPGVGRGARHPRLRPTGVAVVGRGAARAPAAVSSPPTRRWRRRATAQAWSQRGRPWVWPAPQLGR
jgi:hypothetical protein